ncbi:endonuclease/exonuclease/phosphatase family protein [Actinoplanes sp. LDG1-06]|uniref:Endonuclease/exonuclease/phosphatase family protein n=1 Tax=Paractinoplanes ovalisporus TaxID=2810368 RepID=A0ABS2AMY9_9ACTN|nr:endonuclease/exonuclease/phosphatase family protein [Actinoplanes ovalisporus]MBM2620569.1 endonuclease/exonuclease/phosphatase family protein [Actinoplanes ovalisporus]
MRIVSVNAWGGALFDELAAWLPASGADVACLQEVTRTPGVTGWTRFEDAERSLPQRADLFGDVRAALPRHQALFLPSDAGPVEASGRRHHQEFGVATLVAEHLPLVGVDTAYVHGAFVDHDEWTSTHRPRNAVAVRTVDRPSGRAICVVQAHGLRDEAGKTDSPVRREQALKLAELVARIRRPDDLVVLCGDLNLLPGSETFTILAAEAGLTDLVGAADTRTSRYTKPVRHASYLLVSDVGAVKHFEILTAPEVSDHRPLILDI